MLSTVLLDTVTSGSNIGIAYGAAAIGAGLAACGGGIGIGLIRGNALQSIARQPEELEAIRANMILAIAFVEGTAFFGMVIGMLVLFIK